MADTPNPFAQFGPATPVPTASASPVNPFAQFGPAISESPKPPANAPMSAGPLHGLEYGAMSDWDRAAEALARGAGDVAHAVGDKSWTPGASLTAKDLAAEKAFRAAYSQQPGFGVNSVGGQILGSIPTAAIGGEVPGALGIGARLAGAAGAGLETGAPGARGAATGAAVGGALGAAGQGAAAAVRRYVSPEAQTLMKAGVKLTPGQMSGGAADLIEQRIMGTVPLTGDLIRKARDQSIHDFNTATINKALGEVGERLTGAEKSGYGAVAEAGDKLSDAYNKVLDNPSLHFVADNQFANDVNDITKEAQTLPQAQRDQLHEIVNYALKDPTIQGLPTGRQFKTGLATLGAYIKQYAGSALPAERHMVDLLRDYQTALKDSLSRSNPQAAQQLNALDRGWAQLVRIENAAGRRATSDGVFTPADLLASERRAANSVRKRSFSRGEGMVQDWARAAQKVLPSKVPDSGTAGRLTMERGLGTIAGIVGGGEFPHYALPVAGGLLGLAAPYTGLGIRASNAVADPAVRAAIAQALGTSGQYAAAPVSGLIAGQNQ
jgi:hypothetical protein